MKIAFIADSICTSGLGHLNRCLALAESFNKFYNINPLFILNDFESIEWIRQRGFNCTKYLKGQYDFIILDSYLKTSAEISKIKSHVKSLIVFDDLGFPPVEADILINSGICAKNYNYSRFLPENIFIGPNFHPLRLEFSSILPRKKVNIRINNIFVTLGGVTNIFVLKNILDELNLIFKDSWFHVVIGPFKVENDFFSHFVYPNTSFYESPYEISKIMLNADIAITGGGQTMYELAYLGIPAIAIEIASNQRNNITGFEESGVIKSVGPISDINFVENLRNCCLNMLSHPGQLSEMSSKGMKLIDGKGANRIAKRIIK